MCRNDGNGQGRAVLLDPRYEIEAIPVRQPHVGEAQVELFVLQHAAGRADIRRGSRVEIHAAQGKTHELEQVWLVVYDEYHGPVAGGSCARSSHIHQASQRRGSANTKRKMLPPPCLGSYNRVAPFVCASSRARNRPRPVPRPPLKNGSKMRSACSGFTPAPRSMTCR